MSGECKVYRVFKENFVTGRRDIVDEFADPSAAYIFASELHGIVEVGDDEDRERYNLLPGHKYIITIEDEEGRDAWGECSRARCQSVGMFNEMFR